MKITIPKDWRKQALPVRFSSYEYLLTYLDVGTVVKFGGCRDGLGLREIVEIKGDNIVGRKLCVKPIHKKLNPTDRYGRLVGWTIEKTSYMTENGINKIQMFYDETTDSFTKIKIKNTIPG